MIFLLPFRGYCNWATILDLSPMIDKKYAVHKFIKDLENNNRNFNDTYKSKIRSAIVSKLDSFMVKDYNTDVEDEILSFYKATTSFCKMNSNVIFTRGDKGNVTIALDRNKYIKKWRNA